LAPQEDRHRHPPQCSDVYNRPLARIAILPGVRDASTAWWIPLSGNEIAFNFEIQERPVPKAQRPVAQVNAGGFNYFKTLRVPLLRGREFTGRDDIKAPPVAIVNESFAHEFFPGQDPIGKRITPDGSVTPGDPPVRQIVGVVG